MRANGRSALPVNVFNALCQMEFRERNAFIKEAYAAAFLRLSPSDQIELEPMFDYFAITIHHMGPNSAREMIAHLGMLFDIKEDQKR